MSLDLRFTLWFPQLDAVAFRIGNPSETDVVVVFDFFDRDALAAELREHLFQVGDAVVDHERWIGGAEIVGVGGKQGPGGAAGCLRMLWIVPEEFGEAIFSSDAEVFAVPGGHAFGIACAKENAADAGDFFGGSLIGLAMFEGLCFGLFTFRRGRSDVPYQRLND